MRRLIPLGAGIAALAVLALLVPVPSIARTVADWGPAGPVLAVLGGALLLAALVPRTAISLACGALFGALAGAALALAAALVGAVVTFGSTSVRPSHYIAGTALAATPSAVSYAVIGVAIVAPSSVDVIALVPAGLGLLISAAAALYWRRTK